MSEFHLEDISNEEHRDSGAEAFARHSENQGTLDGQAEVTAVPARTSETTRAPPHERVPRGSSRTRSTATAEPRPSRDTVKIKARSTVKLK